jgi:hypothetical protein
MNKTELVKAVFTSIEKKQFVAFTRNRITILFSKAHLLK